jgi:hypothetical protein
MAEGEVKADGERTAAFLKEKARGVVDGGDVVGVEGMTQAQAVGQGAKTGHRGEAGSIKEEEAPCDRVQQTDEAEEQARKAPSTVDYAAIVQNKLSKWRDP